MVHSAIKNNITPSTDLVHITEDGTVVWELGGSASVRLSQSERNSLLAWMLKVGAVKRDSKTYAVTVVENDYTDHQISARFDRTLVHMTYYRYEIK